MARQPFTVRSLKYDLSVRRSWMANLVEQTDTYIKLVGVFTDDVKHSDLGHILAGTVSYETFPFKNWFNYFTFLETDGSLRNHYFNICLPPRVSETAIDYVDLDIDIVVWPNDKVTVLDIAEFEENAKRFNYPIGVIEEALATTTKLENYWRDIIYGNIVYHPIRKS